MENGKKVGDGERGRGRGTGKRSGWERRGKDGKSETGKKSEAEEAGRGGKTGMGRVGKGGTGREGGREQGQAQPGRANPAEPLPVPGPGTRRAADPRSWLRRRLRGPRGSGRGGRCPGRRRLRSPRRLRSGGSAPGHRGERAARPGQRRPLRPHPPQLRTGLRSRGTESGTGAESRAPGPPWIWRRRCPSGSWRPPSPRCRCSRSSTPPISSSPSSTSSTSPVSAALGRGPRGELRYRHRARTAPHQQVLPPARACALPPVTGDVTAPAPVPKYKAGKTPASP